MPFQLIDRPEAQQPERQLNAQQQILRKQMEDFAIADFWRRAFEELKQQQGAQAIQPPGKPPTRIPYKAPILDDMQDRMPRVSPDPAQRRRRVDG